MKTISLSLFMFVSLVAFCQKDTLRGKIKVKPKTEEIDCFATVLGYGKDDKFLSTKDLLKPNKIELNSECSNYEVISFELTINGGDAGALVSKPFRGNTFDFNFIKNKKEIIFLRIENIVIKDKTSEIAKKVPSLSFKIVE